MCSETSGRLYGIYNSNRMGSDLWGKNQFNSTFPLALACYMRDNNIPIVYLCLKEDLTIEPVEIPVDFIFNTKEKNQNLYFSFESRFEPYDSLTYDNNERVDLVIAKSSLKNSQPQPGEHLRALEIKLTVIPDSTTYEKEEDEWAPEIVIRPATTMYCALGAALSCKPHINKIKSIFEPICQNIMHWGNESEVKNILPRALAGLNDFQENFFNLQQPIILQPIWKTEGKKPILSQNAFDIFVWSDFALARVFIDSALRNQSEQISRMSRSALRLTRFLFEYSRSSTVHLHNIYSDMTYSQQSDKEFSLSGIKTYPYMKHARLKNPILSKEVINEIILNDGEKNLSPERRFDQTVYFSSQSNK